MALTAYILATRSLLQNPAASSGLVYDDTTLTRFINTARGQITMRTKCLRAFGTVSFLASQQASVFGNLNLGTSSVTGILGAINIRTLSLVIGTGRKKLTPRPWEWFDGYNFNKVVPESGMPREWAQHAQGFGGSFYVYPFPDTTYNMIADAECVPLPLVDDSTVEAIPFGWTDCIPFFGAYYALLSSQTSSRDREAERMMERFEEFVKAARGGATPDVLSPQYERAPDPIDMIRLADAIRTSGGQAQAMQGQGAQ